MKIDISKKIMEIQQYRKKCEELKKNPLVWEPFQNCLLYTSDAADD